MPEAIGHAKALKILRSQILVKWRRSEEITAAELAKRFPEKHDLVFAWRLYGVIEEEPNDLLVAVNTMFPWSLPLVALPEPINGIGYPHVEYDGKFCLVPLTASFDLPVGIEHLEYLIGEANEVLRKGRIGSNDSDFYTEAQSYWRLISANSSELWIIMPPPKTHAIWSSLAVGNNFVLAPERKAILSWAKSCRRKVGDAQLALVLRLTYPLHPRDYPLTMHDLFRLADNIGATEELRKVVSKWQAKQPLPVIVVFEHQGKTIVLGGALIPPGQVRMPGSRSNGVPGFRFGKRGSARARIKSLSLVPARFPRLKVVPVYREYLETRTAGISAHLLNERHIIIVGCGALGGHLAIQLAQAGVGRLTLIDYDVFEWSNVGRHVLDGSYVGRNKAKAIAENICRRFPDIKVEGIPTNWEVHYSSGGKDFDDADLIVSVTGEVTGNCHLDALVEDGDIPPIIFGWIEPFGVAAHAIFRHPYGGKLSTVLTNSGLLEEPVADLISAPPLPQEPSCGAFYQPYSSLSSLPSIALIGELVVDVLYDRIQTSTHRVWVGGAEAFYRNQLSIHPSWHTRLNVYGYNKRYDFLMPRMDE